MKPGVVVFYGRFGSLGSRERAGSCRRGDPVGLEYTIAVVTCVLW